MRGKLVQLSWELLELKLAYYHPEKIGPSWKHLISTLDADYDIKEDAYRQLCVKLNVKPTAVDMVGFDMARPSCQMVARKLSK